MTEFQAFIENLSIISAMIDIGELAVCNANGIVLELCSLENIFLVKRSRILKVCRKGSSEFSPAVLWQDSTDRNVCLSEKLKCLKNIDIHFLSVYCLHWHNSWKNSDFRKRCIFQTYICSDCSVTSFLSSFLE